MKSKIIIIVSLLFLSIIGCVPGNDPIAYKYLPTGKIEVSKLESKHSVFNDTINEPFLLRVDLDTERQYTSQWTLISSAVAYKPAPPIYTNDINWEKSSVTIDKAFIYKKRAINPGENILMIENYPQLYNRYLYGDNVVQFDEKFLYYARFDKEWVTFVVKGELQDGQKFEFKKKVFLDL